MANSNSVGRIYRNPIAKGEYRNHPCICGSGKKMKKCHGQEKHVTPEEFTEIQRLGREHNKRALEFEQALIDLAGQKEQGSAP